ncbi:MAG: RNA polymerase sigma factor [Terriglobia bacterium]
MVLQDTPKAETSKAAAHDVTPDAGELFERYKDRVYSIALRYSGNPGAAQDISQETFLKLFAGIGTFRGDASFESWLYRLVVNACFDQRRRNWRLQPALQAFFDVLKAPEESVLDDILRSETSERVRNAVANLPSKQRMIVVLRYTQGLTYDDIAAAVGCSPGTVASRLSRAHQTLARRLK